MKKLTYSLIALILVICVASAVFFVKLSTTTKLLDEANEKINSLTETIEGLNLEKDQWDAEKLQLGQSISTVRTALIATLADLDSVGELIGLEKEVEALEDIEDTITPKEDKQPEEEIDASEQDKKDEANVATSTPIESTTPENETTPEQQEETSVPEKKQ